MSKINFKRIEIMTTKFKLMIVVFSVFIAISSQAAKAEDIKLAQTNILVESETFDDRSDQEILLEDETDQTEKITEPFLGEDESE